MPSHRLPRAALPKQVNAMKVPEQRTRHLTPQGIKDVVGDLDDAKLAAILAIGANFEEIEEAVAWASGESDVMGDLERPLEGVVARLYEILTAGEEFSRRPRLAGSI
jgi:hypothetical protein